ncbi:MAG TPA: hypothetical protein VFM02_03525 [Candidatus Paceibacterota bacterium]|nr:hypothetical protein [Candidatus Paceibacterota bacterium]
MEIKNKHVITIGFLLFLLVCTSAALYAAAFAGKNNLEYGLWVWDSPIQISQKYQSTVLSTATSNGMNVLYVTIDDYLDIAELPDGTDKSQKIAAYMNALQRLVSAANARGISVDVEAGWRDWGEADQQYKAMDIIDFAEKYNATHGTAKIRGVQFDVESYLLPTYEGDKALILEHFVQFVAAVTARMGTDDLRLSVVVPHFYDDQQNWTPAITYDGQTTFTFNHVLRILDTRPGSSIIVMAYRNKAQGSDGAIQLSHTEVEEASASPHGTKIIVAQETGNVPPAYVTFYGRTKAYYLEQVQMIRKKFDGEKNFGGIAVDYIDPFLQLK